MTLRARMIARLERRLSASAAAIALEEKRARERNEWLRAMLREAEESQHVEDVATQEGMPERAT